MTVDRRTAAPLLALDEADLLDTLTWVLEALPVASRRRLLNRARMREDRAQDAHGAPTPRAPSAHRTPTPAQDAHSTPTNGAPSAHKTPTGRPQNAHAGTVPSSASVSPLPLSQGEVKQDPRDPLRAGAREELPDGAHPEDADHVLFAAAANRAYATAQRSGAPFPSGTLSWKDQNRLREGWPKLVVAARARGEPVAQFIEHGLAGFLAGSAKANWILWLLDPTVRGSRVADPAPHAAFDAVDDSDAAVAALVGAEQ